MSLREQTETETSKDAIKDAVKPGEAHPPQESVDAAEAAGLRYVTDTKPGHTRKKKGKGFAYVDSQGKSITDKKTIERINALKIPPAWAGVWICPQANGHMQCTGRDERGRKQYLYHADWRKFRDTTKYTRLLLFGEKLKAIRARVVADMKKPGLPREKVLATVIKIMDQAMIRIGNAEYAKTNQSFGLTTLKHKHVDVKGSKISFHFKGKSGIQHDIDLTDPQVAQVVKKCQDLPGQELFTYKNEAGELVDVGSQDVNDYIREIAGEGFTAKDFRTWGGSVRAARCLLGLGPCSTVTASKKNMLAAVRETASLLGNTAAVCRKSYIHPAINDCHDSGLLYKLKVKSKRASGGLNPDELFFLELLKASTKSKKRA